MKLEVHPLAAIFPMLPDDELAELAADIKEHGLLHPIVIGEYEGKEVIVDGRNRFKACELAGVKPEFETLNGEDVIAFILSANVHRRSLTAGQRAMAKAFVYPETTERGGRGKKKTLPVPEGFSPQRLSEARLILRHSRVLAEAVIAGSKTLDAAVTEVRTEQNAADAIEEKMVRLQREASDLAALVTEGRMNVADAFAAFQDRKKRIREAIEDGRKAAQQRLTEFVAAVAMIDSALEYTNEIDLDDELVETVNQAARKLAEIAERLHR